MKKLTGVFVLVMMLGLVVNGQTKKNGTPDMRFKANQSTSSVPKSTPALKSTSYGASRPVYSGQSHTSSHGGTYLGAQNSQSHKGGTYTNSSTNNRYGIHKGR